jgi:hypothetical protein
MVRLQVSDGKPAADVTRPLLIIRLVRGRGGWRELGETLVRRLGAPHACRRFLDSYASGTLDVRLALSHWPRKGDFRADLVVPGDWAVDVVRRARQC